MTRFSKPLMGYLRNAGPLTIATIAAAVLLLIQTLYAAFVLGPDDYGRAVLLMAVPTLVFSLVDARTSAAVIRYLARYRAQNQKDAIAAVHAGGYLLDLGIASVGFALISILASWAASRFVGDAAYGVLMIAYSLSFILRSFRGTSVGSMLVAKRFKTVALYDVGTAALRLIAVAYFLSTGWGVTGVLMGNAIGLALSGIGPLISATYWLRRDIGLYWMVSSLRPLTSDARDIASFVAFSDLTDFISLIIKQADVLIAGLIGGAAGAGYYRLAKSILGVAGFVASPLQSVIFPALAAQDAEGNIAGIRETLWRVAMPVGLTLAAGVGVAVSIAPAAVGLFLSSTWDPVFTIMYFMAPGTAAWLAFYWLRPLVFAQGKVKFWTVAMFLQSIAFILLAWPATSKWGVVGLAATTSFVAVFFHLGAWTYLSRSGRAHGAQQHVVPDGQD